MFSKTLILPILLALVLSADCQPYYFRHYEVESGLSNNAVTCSLQDKLGFMWFGTRDGVNRFDGYAFKTYRFRDKGNDAGANNFVRALCMDSSGTMLLATEKEIFSYDAASDSFVHIVASKSAAIDEMAIDAANNIWFNAGGVLRRYAQQDKRLTTFDPAKFFSAASVSVDNDGIVWASTGQGFLKRYDSAQNSFLSFDLFKDSAARGSRDINIIKCIANHKILIGTNKAGFKIFDSKTCTYNNIPLCCQQLNDLFIRSFLQVSPTEIWIGTETGIFIYNPVNNTTKWILKNSLDQYALSDNVVYTLCKDKEGGVWAGTYFGGVNYYPSQLTPFHKYYYKPFENSLSGNIVREITGDQYGNLWVATEDGGLNKLDAVTKQFSAFKPGESKASISYMGTHDLLAVGNELWVGTYEHGLDILNINTGKVMRHYGITSGNGLHSNFPFDLLQTKAGEIFLATSSGIYTYNKTEQYFDPVPGLPADGFYSYILMDSKGLLWAAVSGQGVYSLDRKKGIAINFRFNVSDTNSISSDKVNYILEDSAKNIWFATENGLCKYNAVKHNFSRYGTVNGFPSNFMLAMVEDNQRRLWVSTTQGLACFSPEHKETHVYTTANGLLSNQFNFSSAFKDKSGIIYFGSAKGMVSFQPNELNRDSFAPPVYITGLQVNNQEIPISKNAFPLNTSILYAEKIVLNYYQSTFSLRFAALGYTAPGNLEYAYRLRGLSDHWTYVKGTRAANFTKLAAGSYVFELKVSGSGGLWNGREKQLLIEILPPWWRTSWAYAGYFILAAALIYFLVRAYHGRAEEKNRRKIALLEIAQQKEIMQLEIAKEREMLESKVEFFTNVAHEIKTPLTLIKVPLATVMEKTAGTPIVDNCLKIMERNTNRLIELSNQLLDFRQTEISGYKLSFEHVNITEILSDIYTNFSQLAQKNNIDIRLQLPPEALYAFVDVDAFNKILYNLVSNAVKYAAGRVDLFLLQLDDQDAFNILVKNDGYIIPGHLQEKIFEPFYRIKETDAKKGTGIGLALARSLAQIHNGSLVVLQSEEKMNVFSLTLPIHNEKNIKNDEANSSFSR